ncbi:MAG: N-acetyltransferase [Wenzhouxiangella sp.]|jgi:hypothetical protein|nr:N-acetyltransferase [Wenzhouxiangella sp.]
MTSELSISPVDGQQDWQALWGLTDRIYSSDPCWIAPLRMERKKLWKKNNPWFRHAVGQLFVARRGGSAVGSISTQFDELQADEGEGRIGYFGQFECINDPEVAIQLIQVAERWLTDKGCKVMRGPYDLGINQSCGLLVEGFETPPMILMGHAPRYYSSLLASSGLSEQKDLLAYLIEPDFPAPVAMRRLVSRQGTRLHFRPLKMQRYPEEVELLRQLFNDAWANNWGFVPLTKEEFAQTGTEIRHILNPDHACIAEFDGQPAGFIIALPNLNEWIRDLRGRLFPTGWAKLLWRVKRGRVSTARVPLMGVRRQFHGGALGAAISFGMIDHIRHALHRDGVEQVEMSWILEDNQGMNSLIKAMGGRLYKRYRMYAKQIG